MVNLKVTEEYVERINDACSLCHETPNFKLLGGEDKPYVLKRGTEIILITNDIEEMFACVSYIWQFFKRFKLGVKN